MYLKLSLVYCCCHFVNIVVINATLLIGKSVHFTLLIGNPFDAA